MRDTPPDNFGPGPIERQPFPWGYLLAGCLTVMLVMLAGVIATGLAGYWLYQGQVAKYTSEEAQELPTLAVSEQEVAAIEQRFESFRENVKQGDQPDQLVLTSDDINALIYSNQDLRGRVYVTISQGKITADVSIPTDAIPGGKGRYFNGSLTAAIELDHGALSITVTEAEVNGEPVPESIMADIRAENLAKELCNDPKLAQSLSRFDSLVIADDRIILSVRESPTPAVDDEPSAQATHPAQAADSVGPLAVPGEAEIDATEVPSKLEPTR